MTRGAIGKAYPRRKAMRAVLKRLASLAFLAVSDLRIEGRENLPDKGPVILAGNHFHFADPVALLHVSKRQVEFVGGFRFPNAPAIVKFLPGLWGYFPVHRGAYSRQALELAKAVLKQDGVLGIFPEGGAWAKVLRPPRGGLGFLAAETGAVVVPVALDGFPALFHSFRPRLTIRIGKPLGPFESGLGGIERRKHYDRIGEDVMRAIAAMLPAESRGVYAEDAKLRAAAAEAARYPFDEAGMRGM